MVKFDAVIGHFGDQAVKSLLAFQTQDNEALQAVRNQADLKRIDKIVHWLQSYQVFLGITGQQRTAIASAVLRWADSRDQTKRLTTEDSLCEAHESLMDKCEEAYGKERNFKSLASKALWLCYPDDVPLLDSFAKRALWVLAKMDDGIKPLTNDALIKLAPLPKNREYRQFVHIWKAFYGRYEEQINAVDKCGYLYAVRVFDIILWIIGTPDYEYAQ
jgi:hypothetical protein